jgi:hypothetical protein
MMFHRSSAQLVCAAALLGTSFAASATAAQAPAGHKTPVFVSHSGQDAAGASLVEAVKDALRRAPSTLLAASVDDADVVLMVSTMNPDTAKPGMVTTAGWTLLLMKEATKAYIGGGLRMADSGSLQKTATDLVTYVEGLLKARSAEIPSSPEYEKVESAWNDAVERAAEKLPEEMAGIKVKAAFREQLHTYLQWATAASLTPDIQQAIAAGLSYFAADDNFSKKIQAQAVRLSACEAELATLKKPTAPVKK